MAAAEARPVVITPTIYKEVPPVMLIIKVSKQVQSSDEVEYKGLVVS